MGDNMITTVDARGLACPQPVILTRNAMRDNGDIETLVDDRAQAGNVQRLAERAGWQTRVEERCNGYAVRLTRQGKTEEPEVSPDLLSCATAAGNAVVALSSDRMGRGEDELGAILMRAFVYTLTQIDPQPKTLVLYNTGVRLAVKGAPVLDDLNTLGSRGVEILVCGTCLDYLCLKERLAVGQISNMYSIAETLLSAGHAITI